MSEVISAIRPALDTLRELDEGRFLDKLAVAIHDATSGVTALSKPSKITITLDFAPLTKQNLAEPVITVEAEIVTKLPKPDGHRALFYVDGEGNPTTQQQRQRGLDLQVAGHSATAKEGTHNQ
jgi:hypothetical protein